MEELVVQKFGEAKWKECLKKAGIPESRTFTILSDVDDKKVRAIINSIARVMFLPMDEVLDHFGEYWSCVYAPKVYAAYYAGARSARELLLNLGHIHEVMTKSVKLDLMPGLIRGVGKYYKENLRVFIVDNAVYVYFP